jgi:hypothetical protein
MAAAGASSEARFQSLALRILNLGISWRHDISREHLLYSERELEAVVRRRNFRETKLDRKREKKRRDQEIKALKMAAREQRRR